MKIPLLCIYNLNKKEINKMDDLKLKKANELKQLIDITDKAYRDIVSWIDKSDDISIGNEMVDYNYGLKISEHRDDSGGFLNLSRYFGNTRLLGVIKDELYDQLMELKDQYRNL